MYSLLILVSGLLSVTSTLADPVLRPRATPSCTTSLSPTPPPRTHCGFHGTLENPQPIGSSPASAKNLKACSELCASTTGCLSFGFSISKKTCRLFSTTLFKQGLSSKKGKNVFYDRRCYETVCTTPIPSLLTNAGFETGTFDPWDASYNAGGTFNGDDAGAVIVSPGYNSNYAALLSASTDVNHAGGTAYATIEQQLTTQEPPGSNYILSFAYMLDSNSYGTGQFFYQVYCNSVSNQQVGQSVQLNPPSNDTLNNAPGVWSTVSAPFTFQDFDPDQGCDNYARFGVQSYVGGSMILYLDQVDISPA